MPQTSKYGAIKTEVNGITFASKAEAERYQYLNLLWRAKEISDLRLQPRYVLQEKFISNGQKVRAVVYCADFEYREKGRKIVEDVKGMATDTALLKFKLFRFKYPDVELRLIKKQGKGWKQIG